LKNSSMGAGSRESVKRFSSANESGEDDREGT
jgi:hypothetical protein